MLNPKDFRNVKECWWPNDPSSQVHMERDEERQAQMRRIAAKGWDDPDGDEARDWGLLRGQL